MDPYYKSAPSHDLMMIWVGIQFSTPFQRKIQISVELQFSVL